MASASSSSSFLPPPPFPRSSVFTPIPEHDEEEEEEEEEQPQEAVPVEQPSTAAVTDSTSSVHNPAQHHAATASSAAIALPMATTRRPSRSRGHDDSEGVSVSCNNCRPTSRDKLISVVPLDTASGRQHPTAFSSSSPGQGGLLRSLFFSLTGRSPAVSSAAAASSAIREDQWRFLAAELSRKLIHTTRKRDEAVLEASRLKQSLAELDDKIDRLESHCCDLRAALQSGPAPGPSSGTFPAESFHLAVADARAAVRHLARSLIAQLRLSPPGSLSSDRVAALIQSYDPRAAVQWQRNPGGLVFYMEALLNRVLYDGFEKDEEEEARQIDPAVRCAASRAGYEAVRGLGWEEVLSNGTRHYSEGLSRFCDRKMSEVVVMVGLARAWPEGLLQAFFGAAKGAWVVRLMARSVHPAVPALRAGRGARFDGRFMEDVASDRARRQTTACVRAMVAPGFHVYNNNGGGGVVKCTVLCAYNSECGNNGRSDTTMVTRDLRSCSVGKK
ncbi:unnamed protein product [Musa acuminata subsp. malaccensis]|uniref:(wild Malaysian banana) hypothetical protein n=1 Tax=Musa acuminata subsp. malaccensis TaxID=214687 RepID=A0A804K6J4_MUSAM|nr:PREDICTED: IRK-interacting protein-like [Musa acuminata subsp. malaccensis]CAG1831531.1 unnamed protein product [Musa acuminata subsp. malaccensis]